VERRANKGKGKERGNAMAVGRGREDEMWDEEERTKYGCEIIDNPHSV
jgi:hypothetical protein